MSLLPAQCSGMMYGTHRRAVVNTFRPAGLA